MKGHQLWSGRRDTLLCMDLQNAYDAIGFSLILLFYKVADDKW